MIYLDHCASTPIDAAVAAIAAECAGRLRGNPSSVHRPGCEARRQLEAARADLASVLGATADSIVFTGSGSEANNLALKGLLFARAGRPSHIVISAIEHASVRECARWLAMRFGWIELTEVGPDAQGVMDPDAVAAALRPETCLVAVMAANHETGMIQPVAAIAALCRQRGVHLHVDAVQAAGKIPLDVATLGCDSLSLAAHKFYGPTGIGALWLRPGTVIDALAHGGHQEGERRAGTEHTAGAVGLAAAARMAAGRLTEEADRLASLERRLLEHLERNDCPYRLNGAHSPRLPGVLNLSFPGAAQADLLVGLDLEGFAVSAGSACASGVIEPSPVLLAMGLDPARAGSALRISFGRHSSAADAEAFADAVTRLHQRLTGRHVSEGMAR